MRTARELHFPDLVWSHFGRPRFGDFEQRVSAAAAAGIAGVALNVHEYERVRAEEERSIDEIRSILTAHGVVVADAELARGWWAIEGDALEECRRIEAVAYEMADELEVRCLHVSGSYDCGTEQAVEGFGALCDRAAEHGLLVALEDRASGDAPGGARAIVEASGRPNAGYCFDVWDPAVRTVDAEAIAGLDPARVLSIRVQHDLLAERDGELACLTRPASLGEGQLDCIGTFQLLRERGVDAPISIAVPSDDLWDAPAADAAREAANAMRRVLREAGIDV